jgi:hypothetical protein
MALAILTQKSAIYQYPPLRYAKYIKSPLNRRLTLWAHRSLTLGVRVKTLFHCKSIVMVEIFCAISFKYLITM